jgi:RNA polymerase sigma-70 factor (ECF subfamily)
MTLSLAPLKERRSMWAGFGSIPPVESEAAKVECRSVSEADRRDIELSVAGDGEAYARLIVRYQNTVAACMWRFTRARGICEELVHDVFVEAYFSLGRFRGEAPFLHWLRKIAVRVGYRHWRRLARERARGEVALESCADLSGGIAHPAEARYAAELVHSYLARLAPRDRLILTLIHLEDLSVEEAAEATGWTKTMVKVQAYRARRRLRRLLEESERISNNG